MSEDSTFLFTLPTLGERVNEEVTTLIDENVRLTLPAEVTNTDEYANKQHVDVKVLIGKTLPDGSTVTAPQIKKVFVKLPAAGGFKETYPIKKGNLVTLHWTQRSLNEFLNSSGGEVFPDEEDKWDLRDCYVTVGFGTRKNNQKPSPVNYTFSNDIYSKVITPDGNITIKSTDVYRQSKNVTTESSAVSHTSDNTTYNTSNYTLNASTAFNITCPQSTFTGNVGVSGVLQISALTGFGGGSSVSSDTPIAAAELHADNGYTGTVGIDQAFVVVDGVIVGLA